MAISIFGKNPVGLELVESRLELGRRAGFPGIVVGAMLFDFDGSVKCCPRHEILEIAANRLAARVRVLDGSILVLERGTDDPLGRWRVLEGASELPDDERGREHMRSLPLVPSLLPLQAPSPFPLVHLMGDCPVPNPTERFSRERQIKAGGPPRWHLGGNGTDSWWLGNELLNISAYAPDEAVSAGVAGVVDVPPLAVAAAVGFDTPLNRVWLFPGGGDPRRLKLSRACGPAVERADGTSEYWLDGEPSSLSHVRAHCLEGTCSEQARELLAMARELGFEAATATADGTVTLRHPGSQTTWPSELRVGTGPEFVEVHLPVSGVTSRWVGLAEIVRPRLLAAISI